MKMRYPLICILLMMILSSPVHAKTPPVMASLKSYVQTYGTIRVNTADGTNRYTSSISYQKKKKRFLFQCKYTNGRSTSTVKMYMPISKKKSKYTINFSQTIRANGLTAKMSGKANLKRTSYNDNSTNLKFSRKNKTKASKKITASVYRTAGNSLTKYAFKLWEYGLENGPTLCFRNFGFKNVSVINQSVYTNEW